MRYGTSHLELMALLAVKYMDDAYAGAVGRVISGVAEREIPHYVTEYIIVKNAKMGYIMRVPDVENATIKVCRLTRSGEKRLADLLEEFDAMRRRDTVRKAQRAAGG